MLPRLFIAISLPLSIFMNFIKYENCYFSDRTQREYFHSPFKKRLKIFLKDRFLVLENIPSSCGEVLLGSAGYVILFYIIKFVLFG
jgi:hypothetical protein